MRSTAYWGPDQGCKQPLCSACDIQSTPQKLSSTCPRRLHRPPLIRPLAPAAVRLASPGVRAVVELGAASSAVLVAAKQLQQWEGEESRESTASAGDEAMSGEMGRGGASVLLPAAGAALHGAFAAAVTFAKARRWGSTPHH